jgi:hypothetical protein
MNRATAAEEVLAQARGIDTRVLENALIRAEVAPARGGKFVSLWSKRTGTEWLLPPLRSYDEISTEAGFELWDGGGFDECLPTVAPTATAPDHGEVWRHGWDVVEFSTDSLLLQTTAVNGAIAFRRRARLDRASLVLDYFIENRSDVTQSLLYCAHPLLRVEEGDRILLPDEVRSVVLEGSAGNRLGKRGDRVAWPGSEAEDDLNIVGLPDGFQADKLFAGPVVHGWCALLRTSIDEGIEITFDSGVLPYLGLWICRAAWPESGKAKQYTVAFEPASAPFDSLADAERAGMAWNLAPGERYGWTLRFRLDAVHQIEARRSSKEAR